MAASRRVLPGFNLTLGYTLFYLSVIVLIPLTALIFKTLSLTWDQFMGAVSAPRVMASYRLTFGASLIAAFVNLSPTAIAVLAFNTNRKICNRLFIGERKERGNIYRIAKLRIFLIKR